MNVLLRIMSFLPYMWEVVKTEKILGSSLSGSSLVRMNTPVNGADRKNRDNNAMTRPLKAKVLSMHGPAMREGRIYAN